MLCVNQPQFVLMLNNNSAPNNTLQKNINIETCDIECNKITNTTDSNYIKTILSKKLFSYNGMK